MILYLIICSVASINFEVAFDVGMPVEDIVAIIGWPVRAHIVKKV